jgi:hypothetical protein
MAKAGKYTNKDKHIAIMKIQNIFSSNHLLFFKLSARFAPS